MLDTTKGEIGTVNISEYSRDQLLSLFSGMELIRQSELRLAQLFADNEIPGFIHLSVGQEAVAVGVSSTLDAIDTVASTHRGHGHALAKGVDVARLFMETMGRAEGYCGGRGGSMHVADASVGMLGANGIVGAGLSIAVGSALAHQVKATGGVAVVFFGDGALSEGLLHECFNLAKLWSLPIVFVCENNGWSEFTPTSREFVGDLLKLSAAFGIPACRVNGNDVLCVRRAAAISLDAARSGGGPQVLECQTCRVRGHFEGDRQKYRDATDITSSTSQDPIKLFEARLLAGGETPEALLTIRHAIAARIDAATAEARRGSDPVFQTAYEGVYA